MLLHGRTFAAACALFAAVAVAAIRSGLHWLRLAVAPTRRGDFAASLGVNISAMTKKSDALYSRISLPAPVRWRASGHSDSVTYTGWLSNGTQFDSNVGKAPFGFMLGVGQVIPGWDQGTRRHARRRHAPLAIGSALATASRACRRRSRANSTLVFKVNCSRCSSARVARYCTPPALRRRRPLPW